LLFPETGGNNLNRRASKLSLGKMGGTEATFFVAKKQTQKTGGVGENFYVSTKGGKKKKKKNKLKPTPKKKPRSGDNPRPIPGGEKTSRVYGGGFRGEGALMGGKMCEFGGTGFFRLAGKTLMPQGGWPDDLKHKHGKDSRFYFYQGGGEQNGGGRKEK